MAGTAVKKQDTAPAVDLSAWKDVWVFIELERGAVHPVSWELLGEGRKLADEIGSRLAGVVLGRPGAETAAVCDEAFAYGADLVYVIKDDVLGDYRNQAFTHGVQRLVRKFKPDIMLLGATPLGRDLAGSVATVLRTGLTADCTVLNIDPETGCMAADRPTFGGSLLCTIQILNYRPQMATVRPRVMAIPEKRPGRKGEVVEEALDLQEQEVITKVLDFIADEKRDEAQLSFADFIITGGRGLAKEENLQLLWRLAEVMGAEVGATRPVVASGWMTPDRQVGQTGKTVRPKLYVAAGVSGAVQHRVGMESSDRILAINTDPHAPIFDFATHGVVADIVQLLPALAEALEERLGQTGENQGEEVK